MEQTNHKILTIPNLLSAFRILLIPVIAYLTAMGRNVVDTGKTAARLMLRLIDGEKVGHIMEEPYERRARESTGPAPAGR